jgi:hypothetical protein
MEASICFYAPQVITEEGKSKKAKGKSDEDKRDF